MALSVDPDEVKAYALAHDSLGAQVRADSQPDAGLLAAMEAGYGAVGAEFTAAFAQFQVALQASGEHLAQRYGGHAEDLTNTADGYTARDRDGAQAVGAVYVDGGDGAASNVRAVGAFDGPGGFEDPDWGAFDEGIIADPGGGGSAAAGPSAIGAVPSGLI